MEIFLESQKETSKLSGDVFWGRWDRMVAQKSNFKIFFFENDVNSRKPPPLLTYLRDMKKVLFLNLKLNIGLFQI